MSDSENASLDFSRLEREDDAWNWDEETAAGQNEEEPDEWTYIVETVCTIGKKKPYEGHENDPVLSSFIRRYCFRMSRDMSALIENLEYMWRPYLLQERQQTPSCLATSFRSGETKNSSADRVF